MSRNQMPPITQSENLDPENLDPGAATAGNRRQWPRYALPERDSFSVTADGLPGAIEDISLGGARLRMDGSLPGSLEMRIEHPRLGHAYARRCWQSNNHLGVVFDHSSPSLAFIADCLAERIGVESL